jgi:serine/threonine-protein kinase
MINTTNLGNLGKYELKEKIGEGGYGIVYKARDPLLERNVAIKVLRMDIASSPDFVERFRREARLAASLRHPNIVSVIEVGEQEGRYYLVMEYLEGEVLSALLKDGKPLPLKQAVEILQPLAEALDYAHGRGLVHRDVKPSNMILAEGGKRPVLTDFGLVKSMTESGLTTTGVALGTVEYMAPEQILGQEPGPAADQYALGVVAFQMLTGKVPFPGKTPFEIQSGHVHQPPPDPCSLNPGLPRALADTLLRALAKDSSRRYATDSKFVAALADQLDYLTSAQAITLRQEAQRAAERLDFETAIGRLEQVKSVHPSPEVNNLLIEYLRRQQIVGKVQNLRHQKKAIDAQLVDLYKQEQWLKADPFDHDTPQGIQSTLQATSKVVSVATESEQSVNRSVYNKRAIRRFAWIGFSTFLCLSIINVMFFFLR